MNRANVKPNFLVILTLLILPPLTMAQGLNQHQVAAEGIGEVTFPISCKAGVQKQFNRAMALLHSFQFEEAIQAFQQVTTADPECAMAHWGIAASHARVVWGPAWISFDSGKQATLRAMEIGGGNERERAYITAMAALFEGDKDIDYHTRVQRFATQMEKLYRDHPQDREAALLYANALLGTLDTSDTTYEIQKQAGAIAEKVFKEQPNHPGAAHYIIHAYDFPSLAQLALPAARRYAQIAPNSAHALHMPSHIFSRLGLWAESIQANRASMMASDTRGVHVAHALDYIVYAHLQRADDSSATRFIEQLFKLGDEQPNDYGVLEHVADIKARSLLERQDWSQYKAINLDPGLDQYPRFEATVRFARAIGAARSGHASEARADAAKLPALQSKLSGSGERYYATNVVIWQRVADAWIAYAEGNRRQALELMHAAAELGDNTVYVGSLESGPDALVHTREQLGDLLLELGRPAEAFEEYKSCLEASPNRFNSIYGAARAAELSGDREKAAMYYRKLVEIAAPKSERLRLQHARAYLKKK